MQKHFMRVVMTLLLVGLVVWGRPVMGQGGEAPKQYFPIISVNVPAQTDPDYQDYVGLLISAQDGDPEVYSVHGDGSEMQQLTHNTATERLAILSPDKTKLAVVRSIPREQAGFWLNQVVVMNLDGSDERVLMEAETYAAFMEIKWSPTGKHLLVHYSTVHNYDPMLMVVGLDSVQQPIEHDFFPAYDRWEWSPNGAYVSYTFRREQATHLWVFHRADGTTRSINANVSEGQPAQPWNPDSRSLLFTDATGGGHTVQPDGNNAQVLPDGYSSIGWIEQGAALLLATQAETTASLYTLPRGEAVPQLLVTHTGVLWQSIINATNDGIFYQVSTDAEPYSLKETYWFDFDTMHDRHVISGTKFNYTPMLSFDKRELLFLSASCVEFTCESDIVAANVDADEITTTVITHFNDDRVRYGYLPFSSTRLVIYPLIPGEVLMAHTPSGEVKDFNFSEFNVGGWRYAPR